MKKAEGSFRPCVDFRMLNRVTIFDAEPMSNPEQIFSSLTRYVFFSKVDCSKGYWQIAIEKTAFSTPSGLFQFRRMPFWLVNVGASYWRMMRKLLYDVDGADNYVDNLSSTLNRGRNMSWCWVKCSTGCLKRELR